jgi:hypothetical protein
MSDKKFLVGVYDDDDKILDAVKEFRGKNVPIAEVFTPFPVHGLDLAMGLRESRLPTVAFIGGITGTTLALTMMIGMYWYDWQINIGGKPFLPLPSFIPITFEVTVLLASFSMVFAYLIVNKIGPGAHPRLVDERQTDDLFFLCVEESDKVEDNNRVKELFSKTGATEVRLQDAV